MTMTIDEANSPLGLASRQLAFAIMEAPKQELHDGVTKLQEAWYFYGIQVAKKAAVFNIDPITI